MNVPVEKALGLWGLGDATCDFVAGRENQVYKVVTGSEAYALRFKRPGYRNLPELHSELQWLDAMAKAGLSVPAPRPSAEGALLEKVAGYYVDMVSWLDGVPLGASRLPLDLTDPEGTFFLVGETMARLHDACDAWCPPAGFERCHWDRDGLLGDAPLWGRFWENPTLDAATRRLFEAFRAHASAALLRGDYNTGLIHADIVRENVLVAGDVLHLIDFDDGGYGYRLFDVATALLKNRNEPNYTALQNALTSGYAHIRALDTEDLDLFLALRAVTYVGWIVPRMQEPGGAERNHRFIKTAKDLCTSYLDQAQAA